LSEIERIVAEKRDLENLEKVQILALCCPFTNGETKGKKSEKEVCVFFLLGQKYTLHKFEHKLLCTSLFGTCVPAQVLGWEPGTLTSVAE